MEYLTLDWLRKHKAGKEMLRVFESNFGTRATIKEVVNYLHKSQRPDLEVWLLGISVPLTIAMIEAGANIHVYNDHILRSSANRGWLAMVKCLVGKYRLDIHAMDDLVLCLAAIEGHLEIVKYLVENNANAHARLKFTLKMARQRHHTKTADFLEEVAARAA